MGFEARSVLAEMARTCREVADGIARRDRGLADQLRRAATSGFLNLVEGAGRSGADRRRCYTIAYGSVLETQAALELASGLAPERDLLPARELADRAGALLWRLRGSSP